jgi:hypothetical protein
MARCRACHHTGHRPDQETHDAGHPRVVKTRIGCPAYAGLSGCLLGRCLLKTVICRVRVPNHVPCRRVALLASRAARRGAGADVIWFCGLQRRHVDAAFAKFLFQSLRFLFQSLCLATGSHRLGPKRPGRAPRTSAICPSAIAVPVAGLAAADRGAAILSGHKRRSKVKIRR